MVKKIPDRQTSRATVMAVWNIHTEREEPNGLRVAEERAIKLAKSGEVRSETRRVAKLQSAKVLAELREKVSRFARGLPTPQRWEDFFDSKIRPTLNALSGKWSSCEECGERFPRSRRNRHYCSDGCSARQRNRGRNSTQAKLQKHTADCALCKISRPCRRLDALLGATPRSTDALSRRRGRLADALK